MPADVRPKEDEWFMLACVPYASEDDSSKARDEAVQYAIDGLNWSFGGAFEMRNLEAEWEGNLWLVTFEYRWL